MNKYNIIRKDSSDWANEMEPTTNISRFCLECCFHKKSVQCAVLRTQYNLSDSDQTVCSGLEHYEKY